MKLLRSTMLLTCVLLAGTLARADGVRESEAATSSAAYQLNWLSINGGGGINATSANYQFSFSLGQSVIGRSSSGSYQVSLGFWYGPGSPACAASKGDMNADGNLTSSDVVLMLNCVFLGTGTCTNCFTDLNCDGNLTSSDVVLELNAVFLGAPFPC